MGEASPVPPGDMGEHIAEMTRDALNRIAADVPVTGLHLGMSTVTIGGQQIPAPLVILRFGPPWAPPGHAEMLFWWSFSRWTLTQEEVDQVVREKMLEARRSNTTEALGPPPGLGGRPSGMGRPQGSRLILPPGSPAGQG